MSFSRSHFSMLVKYIGISFITGAIAHGFFSEGRQIITGIAGIIFFIIGSLLEEGREEKNSWKIIISGAILAIGIGAVTGGLQHFPDSPERSLWIIPTGFALSLLFYAMVHKYPWTRREYLYSGVSLISITLLSVGIFLFIENSGVTGHEHTEITETKKHESVIPQGTTSIHTPILINKDTHPTDTDHHN